MAWTAPKTWASDEIILASGTGSLNEQVRDNLLVLSTHAHSGAAGMGASTLSTVTLSGLNTATFADQSADPSVNGRLQRNGSELLYYDGSSAINLTTADASAGTASLRSLGTSGTTAAAGNHTHTPSTGQTAVSEGSAGSKTIGTSEATLAITASTTPAAANRSWVCYGSVAKDSGEGTDPYTIRLYIDTTLLTTRTGLLTAGDDYHYLIQGFAAGVAVSGHTVKVTAEKTTGSGTDVLHGSVGLTEVYV
jgi:hypothetical protein